MKNIKTLLSIILFIGLALSVQAQKKIKVMGKPVKFDLPKDYFGEDQKELYQQYIQKLGGVNKNIAWLVFSDRRRNISYNKPDENSGNMKSFNFKDAFYVTEERGDWIHIVKGRVSDMKIDSRDFEDYGWVEKSKMLLWGNSLVDPESIIHRKVFLLNQFAGINEITENGKRDSAYIYAGPNSNFKVGSQKLYDLFFVYKKENGKYLIGGESKMSSASVKRSLIGWVPLAKAVEWNTRISLEPNYSQEGFDERKSNDKFRVVGFNSKNPAAVIGQAKLGNINTKEVMWDSDPVKCEPKKLSSVNNKRYKGGVLRFPLLQQYSDYYYSGTVGDIKASTMGNTKGFDDVDDINYAEIQQSITKKRRKLSNYNIFFLIEGTRELSQYKQSVLNLIENLEFNFDTEVNVKIGIGVYRDVKEKSLGKDFEFFALNADKKAALNWLQQVEFDNWNDFDEYTMAHYGLDQSIIKAGFSSEHTNLLFVIGNNADLSKDRVRRSDPASQSVLVKSEKLWKALAENEIDIYSVRCNSDNSIKANRMFKKMSQGFILESAKKQYNEYAQIKQKHPDALVLNPDWQVDESSGEAILINGANTGSHYDPPSGGSLTGKQLEEHITSKVKKTKAYVEQWVSTLTKMVDGESIQSEISSGALEPAVMREIYKLYQRDARKKLNMDSDLRKLVREKYKLYTPLLVAKQVRGAKNRSFDFVMFMPEEDLDSYITVLKKVESAVDDSPENKREALFNAYVNLLGQFTGNRELSRKEATKTTTAELTSYMQGLALEGLEIDPNLSFQIGHILEKKKISNEQLDVISELFLEKLNGLKDIRKERREYEFSYSTESNVYYWIPIKFAI